MHRTHVPRGFDEEGEHVARHERRRVALALLVHHAEARERRDRVAGVVHEARGQIPARDGQPLLVPLGERRAHFAGHAVRLDPELRLLQRVPRLERGLRLRLRRIGLGG